MRRLIDPSINIAALSLRQAVVRIAEMASKLMQKDGYHVPVIICEGPKPFVAQPDFSSPATKAVSMKAIGQQARKRKARRVFLISEAWGVAAAENLSVAPSEHPHRQEMLVVTGRDTTGNVIQAVMAIYRRKGEIAVGSTSILESGAGGKRVEAPILEGFFDSEKAGVKA